MTEFSILGDHVDGQSLSQIHYAKRGAGLEKRKQTGLYLLEIKWVLAAMMPYGNTTNMELYDIAASGLDVCL